ncbi:Glutamyl-Q tRNA(Asp) synthetase [Leclercia adecarboxylata]|uniref:Glutamyl-Q tRNA(Asp) synthetase n=1 Tax=Leclercia adecarboxylata TaxID=83655 RepID=A0A4U9HJ36_9ENTR|nr:Glutamyl-Q tRNA(Asp) synthetase [Leclercia adecarboxylata]
MPADYIGRFAPSPSGELHFGSLIAALGSYLQARARQGIWRVRIEDIDPRVKFPVQQRLFCVSWNITGLHWDGDVLWQSQRHDAYRERLAWLHAQGLSYYCTCTRARIQSVGGVYDGHCRTLHHSPENAAVRVVAAAPGDLVYRPATGRTPCRSPAGGRGFHYPSARRAVCV